MYAKTIKDSTLQHEKISFYLIQVHTIKNTNDVAKLRLKTLIALVLKYKISKMHVLLQFILNI